MTGWRISIRLTVCWFPTLQQAAAKAREYQESMAFPSPPTGYLANGAKAWQEAVNRAKLALLHQENHLNHLEQALEDGVAAGFLSENKQLENTISFFRLATQDKARQAHEVQKTRQALQAKAYNQLLRLTSRRNESLVRRANCEIASTELRQVLAARGIDFDEAQSRRELSTALDASDPRLNSTLRQYQTVHTHEPVEDEEELAAKRHRAQ